MANWNIAHRNSIYRCVAVLKEWCFFPSLSWKIPKSFKRSIASVSPKTIPGDGLRIYWSERGEGRDVVDRRTITRPGKHTKSYWKWPWIVSFPIKNGDVQWLCKRTMVYNVWMTEFELAWPQSNRKRYLRIYASSDCVKQCWNQTEGKRVQFHSVRLLG